MQVVLTVNIDNAAVSFALWEKGCEPASAAPLSVFRIAAQPARTADEYAVLLSSMLTRAGAVEVGTAIIASVVPALVGEIRRGLALLLPDAILLTVGAGLRSGLTIRTDSPVELGANLVAMAVGAAAQQGAPLLVLDCGAVTTLSAIGAGKDGPTYLGCAILPGPALGAEALKAKAALLPDVLLAQPKAAIGTNTVDSMRAGLLLGHVAALEGLIARFEAEMGQGSLPLLVTGEGADIAQTLQGSAVKTDLHLVHRGLYKMAALNERKSGNPPKRG